ncbi:hypothetical protein ABZ864_25275 [Streptomyces sp. NPDC047082]|uniref:hypothetical protein n=1 Tax=Streptomyces sp. NPDC047082 TaxID=3155259 RepID=UPI003400BB7E
MLGPDEPFPPPTGTTEQEEFVRTALALAVHVRAHSWAQADLDPDGVKGRSDVPHPRERQAADAFDVLGRLMLPHSSPEGWTATLVTDWARGNETLEAAVKLGKYILHPTFLGLLDDTTRMVGEALHNINVDRLHELAGQLRACAGDLDPRTDPLATLVEDLDATQVDDQPAPVPEPREKRQVDVLPDDEEERPRRFGRISAKELESLQRDIDPDIDPPGLDDRTSI